MYLVCGLYVAVQGEAASARLRELLGPIMLRRTQGEVLATVLPPQRRVLVRCPLSAPQRRDYDSLVARLFDGLGLGLEPDAGGGSHAWAAGTRERKWCRCNREGVAVDSDGSISEGAGCATWISSSFSECIVNAI